MSMPPSPSARPSAPVLGPLTPARGLLTLDATELLELLRGREVSAVELLDEVLRRGDEIAGPVNPFAFRLDERARADAVESDRRLAEGTARPLEGLPLTAKDSQWLAGVPTTSGSLARADFVPTRTVGAVRRVLDAGAVVFAKTTTSEFCYTGLSTAPAFGATANPMDLTRTAGGSSGGAAAAVAAHAGPVGLGGDGGGSIRIPAAFCGLVGYKPTFGLVSHEPSDPGWKSLVSVGPIVRSVADAALLLDVLTGPDPWDRHSVPGPYPEPGGPLRLAVSEDLGFAPVDDDVLVAFRRAVEALGAAGVEIVPAHPGLGSSVEEWAVIATAEARWGQDRELTETPALLSPEVRDYLAFGGSITTERYIRAQFRREEIHRAYLEMFDRTGACALFTPTVGCVAFDGRLPYPDQIGGVAVTDPWRDWGSFLYDANLAGLPACTVPIGSGAAGLPVGGQILGPRLTDRTVLRVAAALETALADS
jgi:Asp-tRNA(Asn)/Glu-tRNA(Gln) amidotransferase A subunit family amidase